MPPARLHSSLADDREPLSGLVERVTYHKAENGYFVLRVKAHGHRDLVTDVGYALSITPGEYVKLSGCDTSLAADTLS